MIGIIIFLVYRYCKNKQNSPTLRRGSELIEGGLKRISTLGSRYNQVPSSAEDKELTLFSTTITLESDSVSRLVFIRYEDKRSCAIKL